LILLDFLTKCKKFTVIKKDYVTPHNPKVVGSNPAPRNFKKALEINVSRAFVFWFKNILP